MKRTGWKRKIRDACMAAGTYKPFFESTIETLAILMETRDLAQKEFEEGGCKATLTHVNQGGFENVVKNPALLMVLECNAQALNYWRDLGLTSKAWKSMQSAQEQTATTDGLSEVLANLGI